MIEYPVGSIKAAPNGRAVAIRNELPGQLDWSVMTVDHGGHHAKFDEVADWPDIPTSEGTAI